MPTNPAPMMPIIAGSLRRSVRAPCALFGGDLRFARPAEAKNADDRGSDRQDEQQSAEEFHDVM
ncbi:MAG: hypothetical protein EBW14_21390 [Oxalobacteraceae bacterium]|nr:hypothetical protein [Oxalobacteraceae bacterium]